MRIIIVIVRDLFLKTDCLYSAYLGSLLQLMDTVCNQLYNFYRSREIELQRFTLQFLPTLIYIYLNSAAHGDIKVKLYYTLL